MILARTAARAYAPDALGRLVARLVPARGRVLAIACCHAVDGRAALVERLARELVLGGLRTLLVDADHLEPELHAHFGVPAVPGLAQVLAGGAQPDEAGREVEPGLWLLPAGLERPAPPPLVGTDAAAAALHAASERFGAVVVVTPPLLSDSVGAAACRGADVAVLVLAKGVARKEEAARAARLVRESGTVLGGAVVVP